MFATGALLLRSRIELLLIAIATISGCDKQAEAWLVNHSPAWMTSALPRDSDLVTIMPPQKCVTTEEKPMPIVNLEEKLAEFSEHWSPKIVGRFNGHDVIVSGHVLAMPDGQPFPAV